MNILSGKELAAAMRAEVTADAERLSAQGTPVKLAIVTATTDESSQWYVRSIVGAASKCGISAEVVDVSANPSTVRDAVVAASADPLVHAVIVQTPLPDGVNQQELSELIDPSKDVDGANPLSLGRLTVGTTAFAPATAQAVMELLDHHQIALSGKHVVIVGRSTVVGKPLAQLMLARDATVTVCHSRTSDLPSVTSSGDIVVAAVGRAELLKAEHFAPGSIVVDVGTNPTADGGLVGDVDAAAAESVVGALSPVPGGVGPVTTALLLRHAVDAAQHRD